MDEYCIRDKLSTNHDKKYYRPFTLQNGSLSPKIEKIRGIIDIAESSDDRFSYRSVDWSPAQSDDEIEKAPDFTIFQNLLNQLNLSNVDKCSYDLIVLNQSEENAYFILNVKLLSDGLQTIPFYKRMDYPAGIFDKIDIKRMNQEAEVADKNYAENPSNNENLSADDDSKRSAEVIKVDENSSPLVEKKNDDTSAVIQESVKPEDAVAAEAN